MSIIISELARKHGLLDDIQSIINEQPFDFFARATTNTSGKKCIFLSDVRYVGSIDDSTSMIITTKELVHHISGPYGVCVCDDPRGLFFELLSHSDKECEKRRVDTRIGKNCVISKTAIISPYNVVIGDNAQIGDFVVIHPNTTIGDNVIIQTGARIAEQDFNVYSYQGRMKHLFHGGNVIIGSNVLISSGVLIGQALYSYGKTSIGDNSYIGADTCIGHNTEIDIGCEICGNSMIGGFCFIGKNSRLFMSVTIANSLRVGENVTVNMGSVVIRSIDDGKTVFGNPAREIVIPQKG